MKYWRDELEAARRWVQQRPDVVIVFALCVGCAAVGWSMGYAAGRRDS